MRKQIGNIGVDAGCVWVGDPCYVLGEDASSHVKEWTDFCALIFDEASGHRENNYSAPLGDGVGFCIDTAWGDGSFPVFVETDSTGRVMSITIDFDYNEDEDEDDDLCPDCHDEWCECEDECDEEE